MSFLGMQIPVYFLQDVMIVSFTQYGDILTISSTTRHMALIISLIICNDSINDVNKTR